ncbi:MAG: hypothetical protein KGZ69_06390 [Methylomonas sp.]|nr:hypothetical protein [Methylomonas sp.]
MKQKFNWYFPTSEEEINVIWKNGLLTVDANVLLDLYRYHDSTRNALIGSLKNFDGRLWLSNQASEEFIRNRSNVIVSSEKTFKQAKDEVEKLKGNFESTITQLKGNRIIPAEVADRLIDAINPAIDDALAKISNSKSSYPKYLQEDPILDELTKMFENSVGDKFTEEELPKIIQEAEERKKKKTPPGYLDDEKDGDRPYGDFFLWRQILLKSKNEGKPIIFVTSERKDDWWEKISGKTIGPRPELLREASEFGGQRILIYQTDRFLEFSSQRSGSELDSNAVDEIRAVDLLRSDTEHAVEVVEQKIIDATEFLQEGILVVNLQRPVKNLTGSGYFEPYMHNAPAMTVTLTSAPDELGQYKLRAGTGTNYDFNLHIISGGQLLPVGRYTLKYKATCDVPKTNSTTISKLAGIVGIPSEKLLEVLNSAGIDVTDENEEISDTEKLRLLQYLRSQHSHD